ncbi:MAG TPA: HAMP domain-containing sensor histidine kinase [Stellaceae bacterium]|nr:HAMP domain-containing sensor histidine kinase [Stellaceae bacterium]
MQRDNPSLLDDYCLQLGSLLDRRHTERALTGARQNAERAARLAEEALEQARTADRAKTNFLANVTHELRTPLNAIIGFSEIIESGAAHGDQTAYGKYIHEAGSRLLGVVNDVLTLARIEAGKLELDEQVASLDEVVGASVKTLTTEAAAKGITIAREPGPDHLVVLDPSKMKQVFTHLLSNAIKFNREGGNVSVAATTSPSGGLAVSIRDTGCGIPADCLEQVLEPFGQLEDHLTRENEGVGLGLPLARAMTGMHGGHLALSSVMGVGTIVEVTLPASRLRATPAG